MSYEWDAGRARKAYFLKILAAWGVAIIVVGFPVMMVVNAMAL